MFLLRKYGTNIVPSNTNNIQTNWNRLENSPRCLLVLNLFFLKCNDDYGLIFKHGCVNILLRCVPNLILPIRISRTDKNTLLNGKSVADYSRYLKKKILIFRF